MNLKQLDQKYKPKIRNHLKKRNKAGRNALICIVFILLLLGAFSINTKKINLAKGIDLNFLEQFKDGFMPTNTKNIKL